MELISLAYIGPGAGLAVIGTVLAFIGAVLFGIGGFIWYPIKRLRAKLSGRQDGPAEVTPEAEKPEELKSV